MRRTPFHQTLAASTARVAVTVAVTVLAVAATACGTDREPARATSSPRPEATRSYRALFDAYSSDYDPAPTFGQLADASAIVVLGRLQGIADGPTEAATGSERARSGTLVHRFDVVDVLRGRLDETVVAVDVPRPGPEPASTFDRALRRGAPALLYLVPGRPRPGATTQTPQRWVPTTPQGFLLADGDDVVVPLVPGPAERAFPDERPDPHDLSSWLPPSLVGRARARALGSGVGIGKVSSR